MNDYEISLPDGRSIVVNAPNPEAASKAARLYLSKESGKADARRDGAAQAFGQGIMQGAGDEFTALVRATAPGFSNWMMRGPSLQRDESIGGSPQPSQPQTVSNAPAFSERYEEELARERAKAAEYKKTNPNMATALNIGGTLLPYAVAGMAGVPLAPAGGVTMGNLLKSGAVGATIGAGTGFAEGEGGFRNRAAHSVFPAAVGGVTGAVAPVVGSALRYGYEKIAPPTLNSVARLADAMTPKAAPKSLSAAAPEGGQVPVDSLAAKVADVTRGAADRIERNAALRRLALEIERSGGTAAARHKLTELGDAAFLIDTSKGVERLANTGYILPGPAADKYKKVLTDRAAGSRDRLVSAFEGADQPPGTYALRGEGQHYDRTLRNVGERAYAEMEAAGLRQTPELMALYENPNVAAAINRVMAAEQSTRVGTGRAPASPVEIMHKVKQAIWDLGFDKETARPGPMASWYRDLGVQYMDRLKAANPALAEADRAYSHAASLPEFFDAGYSVLARGANEKAMNASAPALADRIEGATLAQVGAARSGATNAVRDTVETASQTLALAKRIVESNEMKRRLAAVYGQEQAEKIVKQSGIERAYAETMGGVLGGPQTAQRLASIADDAALSLPTGGTPTSPASLVQYLANEYNAIRQPNEAIRSRIADFAANPDQAVNAETLKLIDAMIRRGMLPRSLVPGVASTGGAQRKQAGDER